MEAMLKEILHELKNVNNRLDSLEQGQKTLVQGQMNLEQGQKALEKGQIALEQGQIEIRKDIAGLKENHGGLIKELVQNFAIYNEEIVNLIEDKTSALNMRVFHIETSIQNFKKQLQFMQK